MPSAAMPSFAPVYFGFNSEDVADDGRERLQQMATWMHDNPQASVTISGHCDERGTPEYNLALGDRRARAARAYLTRLGIAAGRVEIISYGSEHPAEHGGGEEKWAKNRRDEFSVAGAERPARTEAAAEDDS